MEAAANKMSILPKEVHSVLVILGLQTLLINDLSVCDHQGPQFSIQASSFGITKTASNPRVEVNIRKIDHFNTIVQPSHRFTRACCFPAVVAALLSNQPLSSTTWSRHVSPPFWDATEMSSSSKHTSQLSPGNEF